MPTGYALSGDRSSAHAEPGKIFWRRHHEPVLKVSFICRSLPPSYKLPMNALHRFLVLLVLAGAAASGAVHANEHGDDDHEQARQALEHGQVMPLRAVLDKVEREYGGQVLKVEFERDDGRFIYEIRILQTDGRVAKLEVDAVNGQVLQIRRKEH